MSAACVVMVIKYFECHLWVETHSTGDQAWPVLLAKRLLAPNCGSHFSFIGLVISVSPPTDSGGTLAFILVIAVVHSFPKR